MSPLLPPSPHTQTNCLLPNELSIVHKQTACSKCHRFCTVFVKCLSKLLSPPKKRRKKRVKIKITTAFFVFVQPLLTRWVAAAPRRQRTQRGPARTTTLCALHRQEGSVGVKPTTARTARDSAVSGLFVSFSFFLYFFFSRERADGVGAADTSL